MNFYKQTECPKRIAVAVLSFSSTLWVDLFKPSSLHPTVTLWVSDLRAAWQELEGKAWKLSSIDPEWISNTLILSIFETI